MECISRKNRPFIKKLSMLMMIDKYLIRFIIQSLNSIVDYTNLTIQSLGL